MPYPATRPTPSVSADEPSVKTRVYPSAERVSKIPSSSAARCCLRSRRVVSLRCFFAGRGAGGRDNGGVAALHHGVATVVLR